MSEATTTIIKCPSCGSQIAVDRHTIYPVDCDCGAHIWKKQIKKLKIGSF